MLLIVSKSELDKIDTSIFTLNHTICTDIINEVYPKLKNKPRILMTDEFVKENYYLNEEKVVSIIKSIHYLTGYPIVYMTKTLDYISTRYNTEDYLIIVNEDILTYPVMQLDSIIEDTDIDSFIKDTGNTLQDSIIASNKFINTLNLNKEQEEYINYLTRNLKSLNETLSIFEIITRDNSMLKEQLNIKNATTDNLVEKIKYLESINSSLKENIDTLKDSYTELYGTLGDNIALLREYQRIYESLSIYGVYNEANSINRIVNTDRIVINKAPVIIYIKEVEYQKMFKEFISRIPSLFKTNLGLLTKVVVLENTNTKRISEYTDYNTYIHGITLESFIDKDRWINFGTPYDLLHLLSTNESSYDLYIVWDRTLNINNYVKGHNVANITMLEDVSKHTQYNVPKENIISTETTPIIEEDKFKELNNNERLINAMLANTSLYKELNNLYIKKKGVY